MFDVITVTTYTAGTDTSLVSGETGYVKIIKAMYVTNLGADPITIDVKQDGAVVARLNVAPNDTMEIQSTLAVPEGSTVSFNAQNTGLNIVAYVAKLNKDALTALL